MNNVSKLLAAAVLCGLAALPSFTAPGAAATDAAAAAVEPEPDPSSAQLPEHQFLIKEIMTDECSGDVVIKVPFPNPDLPTQSLDDGDIILARSEALCNLVAGSPPTHKGVCHRNPGTYSEWSDRIKYSSLMNGETRRFRWFCNLTRQRSRCPEKTTHVRFRLAPDGEFQTKCLRQLW